MFSKLQSMVPFSGYPTIVYKNVFLQWFCPKNRCNIWAKAPSKKTK